MLLQWLRAQPQLATAPAAELHVIWERLTRLSMRLAKQAVQKMGAEGRVRVAGALPPLGASFCSETPMDLLTAEPVDVSQCYLDQATVLNDEGCDIFLVETCASVAFASAPLWPRAAPLIRPRSSGLASHCRTPRQRCGRGRRSATRRMG